MHQQSKLIDRRPINKFYTNTSSVKDGIRNGCFVHNTLLSDGKNESVVRANMT